jgi:peptidyl-prolyl cis-trans isomerase B (cyclophilin B)
MRARVALLLTIAAGAGAHAQTIPPGRLAILQAEARGAANARDLSILRAGVRAGDVQTVRIAVRALGRLGRPALILDLTPALRHPLPEIRAEAANAVAQAAQGLKSGAKTAGGATAASAAAALMARLTIEAEPGVRAALYESIARLPYHASADVEHAEAALLQAASKTSITDQLGLAKAFEALIRLHRGVHAPGAAVIAYLNELVSNGTSRPEQEALREARVRRLALEALATAGPVGREIAERAAMDPDPQVRRLAIRAVANDGQGVALLVKGVHDPAGMVRRDALAALHAGFRAEGCAAAVRAIGDSDLSVALTAIDLLGDCRESPEAVQALERLTADVASLDKPRAWHRGAHAIVALASADPAKARTALAPFVDRSTPQVRMYAARDAAQLRRLAAPRARITIRDVGQLDVALFTSEAPATVLRFVHRAQAGEFNGADFVLDNPRLFVRTSAADWADDEGNGEVGLWPHVRGALGLASHADGSPADFFFDPVDAPQLDHRLTVFGQVLNGIDLLDQIAEGDVIESVDILP